MQNIKNVIIAAKNESMHAAVTDALSLPDGVCCMAVTSGKDVRVRVTEKHYDMAVVSTPLTDEFGLDLAAMLDDKTDAGIVVLVKGDIADEVRKQLSFTRALVLGRPLVKTALYRAARDAVSVAAYVSRLKIGHKAEIAALTEKSEELKLVFRAKLKLVETKGFTEEQAHKFLQQQAMSRRCSLKTAAMSELE